LTQQEWRRRQWRRWGLPTAGVSTTRSNGPMSRLHPHAVQALQKLELLPHSRWQCQQWAHQQDVRQAGPSTQPTCNKDQHDERVSCGPSQDDSTLSLRPRAPSPMPATSSCPCNLAAASTPRQLHHIYTADGASRSLPPDALYGAAIQTYASSVCSACSSHTRTTGGHDDDALLCTVPSASSLLTIRGEQR
jgi:hypothetical protein